MSQHRKRRPPKRYSKVSVEVWGDDKFMALSPMPASGQSLWLYLLLCPYRSVIPGLVLHVGLGTIADRHETWSYADVERCWQEIEARKMARADWRAGVIWLPKAIVHNEPESPNVVKGWGKVPLPKCALVTEALRSLQRYIAEHMGDAFLQAFAEAFTSSFPESRARARARSTSPLSPRERGVDLSTKPPTRVERAFAEVLRQRRADAGLEPCPHTPPCPSPPVTCIGRIVQEKRMFEANGQKLALEEAS
jgi:hypothetical protein